MTYGGLLPPIAQKILQKAAMVKPGETDLERKIRIENAIEQVQRQFPDYFTVRWGNDDREDTG